MPWFDNLISAVTGGNKKDIDAIKKKVQAAGKSTVIDDADLQAYIADMDERLTMMTKQLKGIYKNYDVQFNGFRALNSACETLRACLKKGKDEAYNNLIKLDSAISTEQKRHLSLIRMAITKDGKKVMDGIIKDPTSKAQFIKIFGAREVVGTAGEDGTYQRLWAEINKLAEYLITHKNKVYH